MLSIFIHSLYFEAKIWVKQFPVITLQCLMHNTWFLKFGVEELDWPAQIPDLTLFRANGINWNANCEPDIFAKHQRLASLLPEQIPALRSQNHVRKVCLSGV